MVYSPPRPKISGKPQTIASPGDEDADERPNARTQQQQQQQPRRVVAEPLFGAASPSFIHSPYTQQQQQSNNRPKSASVSDSRASAAWVNASLNPQRKPPSRTSNHQNHHSVSQGGTFRKLPPPSSSSSTMNESFDSATVALVPTAAEMAAMRRIVAHQDANPANPNSPVAAFGVTGKRTDPYSRPSSPSSSNNVNKKNNNNNRNLNNIITPPPQNQVVDFHDDDNDEEEEEEFDEEFEQEQQRRIQDAYDRHSRFAKVNRNQAVRLNAHLKISNPISPDRLDTSGNVSIRTNQQQQQQISSVSKQHVTKHNNKEILQEREEQHLNQSRALIRQKRPTYVVLNRGGKVEDVVPMNQKSTRNIYQPNPAFRQYEVDDDDYDEMENYGVGPVDFLYENETNNNKNNNKKQPENKTTYIITRGHSFLDDEEEVKQEQEALVEAARQNRRRAQTRGPLFSPVLPGYPNQEELQLVAGEKERENPVVKMMEKQFNDLQQQLINNNKQMQAVAEERLRVLARTLADAEDVIREERNQNELLRAELATSKQSFETLQTTLSSERQHWVQDREANRNQHQEHIKALEKDWTMKIEKANNDIARFLTQQEFEREQHSQQISQMKKRQREVEIEVKELQTEIALHVEGAKRAAKIVEAERKEADDRIVAAFARADGFKHQADVEESKLRILVKELQQKLEGSLKREEALEADMYQILRRVEDSKINGDVYERKYNDATVSLQVELEKSRSLMAQVDQLRSDLAMAEGEKEARKILERQNDELERQLSEMRRTVTELMRIARQ